MECPGALADRILQEWPNLALDPLLPALELTTQTTVPAQEQTKEWLMEVRPVFNCRGEMDYFDLWAQQKRI